MDKFPKDSLNKNWVLDETGIENNQIEGIDQVEKKKVQSEKKRSCFRFIKMWIWFQLKKITLIGNAKKEHYSLLASYHLSCTISY